ncbi:MAG TPA: hypothetical protein DDX70_09910 [Bacteroides sp.]|jgi:hypothetical protein|uniref:Uncharacterized protein n=1 Tax=Bacteroides pectinophilus CAG:437 TaxID=1263051 RepID=R7B2S6_9FIRM|nr:putative uncharacterized protein [Bacteroides pectinophilus CAG:437]HBH93499.1 hypothetical protein [Bacteroides sp.]
MVGWFTEICDMFIKFVGTGWFHWLIAAIILVAGSVKNTHFRHKFLYPAAMILIVFFCPLVYGTIGIRFLNGMYWRILWLVPVSVIIAIGGTWLVMRFNNYILKAVTLALTVCVIAMSGRPMFSKDNYVPAQNEYQLPQVTIDIADAIISDSLAADTGVYPTVVVPDEMLCSMRQYTTKIRLLYGRDAYAYIFNELEEMKAVVHNEMIRQTPDVGKLAVYAKAKNVDYIVFSSVNHKGYQDINMHGYEFVKNVDGYDIYMRQED